MQLFHYTDLDSAWVILSDQELRKNESAGGIIPFGGGLGFAVTQPRPGISLTTNPDMRQTPRAGGEGRPWGSVRIELDGNLLAARGVKLEPYVDRMHGITEEDRQNEILVRQNELSIKDAVLGVEMILEEHLHEVAYTSIEQVYDEVNQEHENMPYEQKRAKYDPDETAKVREFVAWCRKQGIQIAEVSQFSAPCPEIDESRLLGGKSVLRPPESAPAPTLSAGGGAAPPAID